MNLHFGAIDTTNLNKRERGKKETVKIAPNSSNITNILKKEYVCMGMHEHVICKRNCIMGSAQSNPTSIQSIAHI